jgi:hypothetical protein
MPEYPDGRAYPGPDNFDWLAASRDRIRRALMPNTDDSAALLDNVARLRAQTAVDHMADATIVTEVIGLEQLHFTDQEGNQRHEPVPYPWHYAWHNLLDISVDLGEGEHTLPDIARATKQSFRDAEDSVRRISEIMPAGLFDCHDRRDSFWTTVHVGNIALASRQATPQELEARAERDRQARIAEHRAKRERLDSGKVEYDSYDHAVITVSERKFMLATDRANTILAARILQFIASYPRNLKFVDGEVISNAAWAAMTTSERLLFTRKDDEMFKRKGTVVHKYAMDIMRQLMSPLLVTRETTHERFKLENPLEIAFNTEPPTDEGANQLTPIFPPGTPREDTLESALDTIPDIAYRQADILLAIVDEKLEGSSGRAFRLANGSLDQDYAHRLLDVTAERNVKRALRERLTDRRGLSADDAIERVRLCIEATLLEGYEGALRECMIGGYSAHGTHGGVRQISGDLPIRTQSFDIIKKWRIGFLRRSG